MIKIALKPCGDDRRKVCIYRKLLTGGDDVESCTNQNNVLKGCPMVLQEAGCRNNANGCREIGQSKIVEKNGQRYLEVKKCSHHIDNIKPKMGRQLPALVDHAVDNIMDRGTADMRPGRFNPPRVRDRTDDDFFEDE